MITVSQLTSEIKQWKDQQSLGQVLTFTDERLHNLVVHVPETNESATNEELRAWRKFSNELGAFDAQFLPFNFYQSNFISQMILDSFRFLDDPEIPMVVARTQSGKLKVGFLSCDITMEHPLPHIVLRWIYHLGSSMDVVVFDTSIKEGRTPVDDRYLNYVKEISRYVDLRSETSLLLEEGVDKESQLRLIAKRITGERLDIFVDLTGFHTGRAIPDLAEMYGNHLSEVYVVPGVAFAATTGSYKVDFYGTDLSAVPYEFANCFTERLAYIPGTYFHVGFAEMFPHILDARHYETRNGTTFILNSTGRIPELTQDEIDFIGSNLFLKENEMINKFTIKRREFVIRYEQETDVQLEDSMVDIENGLASWSNNQISVTARCQYGLPEDVKIIGNFNNIFKWTMTEFTHVLMIMDRCKDSVLWIRHDNSFAFRESLKKASGDVSNRVYFATNLSKEEHLRRLQLVDVMTDCFPCNGHTTTADALFAGVPVVTRVYPNGCKASRVGRSILGSGMKLPFLVAPDKDTYVERILEILQNHEWSDYLRNEIRNRVPKLNMFRPQVTAEIWRNLFQEMLKSQRLEIDPNPIPLMLDDEIIKKLQSYESTVEEINEDLVSEKISVVGRAKLVMQSEYGE